MITKIQLRRDSSANWIANNPTLAIGEIGIDTSTFNFKIGNGVDSWNNLNYFSVEVADVISQAQLNAAIALLPGDGLTLTSGVLDIDNPFDPSGTYSSLRAQATTKEDVGLGNVTNESKETMFTSAALTGEPTAPTPAASTNTNQIATAAFVQSEITAAGLALGTNYAVADIDARDNLTGLVVGDVVFVADDGDDKWAQYKVTAIGPVTFLKIMDQDIFLNALSAADVKAAYESNADTNAFTDTLKTKLETTDVFDDAGTYANLRAQATTAGDVGLGNVTNESKTTMFTDPTFTGIPIAPTAASTTNTTQIATTAFVQQEIAVIDGGEFN